MDIGLLDHDALFYPNAFYPNLEIMKLSTYYKKNKDYVSLILNMNNTDRYNKIVLRKEINDENYPSSLLLDKRCEYGGRAFTNGEYIPFDMKIENSIPDLSIYNLYFKTILKGNKKYLDMTKKYLNSSFIRLSSNGKDCDIDISKSITQNTKRGHDIFVYDNNIFKINNSINVLEENTNGAQKVLFINFQKSSNFEDIEKLCRCKWCGAKNEIIYDKVILNKEFKIICEKSQDFFVKPSILMCCDKNKTYTRNFLISDFKNSLNRAIYSITTKSKIKFKCKEEPYDDNFKMLYRSLDSWISNNFVNYSFYDFILNRSKKQIKFLDSLIKNDSILKDLVNVAPGRIRSKGGKWLL